MEAGSNIREQISNLIELYKEDFKMKTGIPLTAYPAVMVTSGRVELDRLMILTESYLKMEYEVKNRNVPYLTFRKFFIRIAIEMKYPDGKIAKTLGIDRTTIIHYKQMTNWTNELETRYREYRDHINK